MSTMKYKATERYSLGWTDPRAIFDGDINVNRGRHTGYTEVPTDVLRNLWMAYFGSRVVLVRHLWDAREEDISDVAQELVNRGLVTEEMQKSVDQITPSHYYRLAKEDANS